MTTRNKRQTILIVDDNSTNLKVAVDNLKPENYDILTARNGVDGIKRTQLARPDLILLDVRMPGMDGFETCRQLKQDEETRDIPVIFMTALADVDDKVQGFDVGGVDYITKPFHAAELQARVRTHLSMHNLQTRLEERVSELDAFAHSVAHDLKNPLARMMLGMDIVADELEMAGQVDLKPVIEASVKSGRQMLQIIDSLLLLAGVRKQDVVPEPVVMEDVVDEVQERLEDMIMQYEAEVILPETWPLALGYAPWLVEVWVNYVSNGLKYGGRPPRLQFGYTEQPAKNQIVFWLRDNGVGMSAEDQAKLFTEFARLEPDKIDGHGLGLSIVKRIVNKLGGRVGVRSKLGEGSMFYFTLPVAKDA